MRTRYCLITLVAITLLGPPTASVAAHGVATPQSLPKDYSRNSVTGEYLPDPRYGVGTSSLAGTTSASTSGALAADRPTRPAGEGRAPWTNLVSGLVGVCLGAGGVAIATRTRRRTRHASAAA
jgi:hypothetical protein